MSGPSVWRRVPNDPTVWFSPEQIARARQYQRPLARLRLVRVLLRVSVLCVFAFGGGAEALVDWLGTDWWVAQLVALIVALDLVALTYDLPLDAWVDLRHDRDWNISTQTARGLLIDTAKSVVLGLGVGIVLLVPLWWLFRTTDWWWLWGWLGFVAFSVVLGVLYPVVIAPIFNRFEPLPPGELADRLRAVAARAGTSVSGIFVADESRRSRRDNAYVAGLGVTRRMVVYDTLLEHPPEVVEQVVAHELGHQHLGHLAKQIPIMVVLSLAVFGVLRAVAAWDGLFRAANADGLGDPVALPLVILVFGAALSLVGLGGSWLSRAFERQADRYALELLRGPETMADMHRRLGVKNLTELAPGRWRYAQASHPSAAERLEFTDRWARDEGFEPPPPTPVEVDATLV